MPSRYWQFLQNCLHSGDFNGVSLGMTREQVQAPLGEPDDMGGAWRKQRISTIWKYGEVELQFDQSGALTRFFWEDDSDNWICIDENGSHIHRPSE